ncbi:hypothetical protein L596_010918 [Steinernema carpocapsae]|uniref:Elongator complex protein 1 n=1 Tax=Steinernema carpocapsae TaxID=34508 RepID=A0A4U5PKJ0_STECR|nr:hypothetical protein L596_010918 [Steinernema carpocapsae]
MIEAAQCTFDPEDCVTGAQWSPDFSTLCIATKNNIQFLTRDFITVTEDELNPNRQGSAELMTVGWGSRETQFQGSVGRKAREGPDSELQLIPVNPEVDDCSTSISWNSSGEHVSVNSVFEVEGVAVRAIRIWSREGELISRCVPLAGMESCLSTRPAGNLIATSRLLGDKRSVCFYEKNGQRRYQFDLPENRSRNTPLVKIESLSWNADATVLAVHMSRVDESWVDFYVVSNYKWDLKYVLEFEDPLVAVRWDAEQAKKCHIMTSCGSVSCLTFEAAYDNDELIVLAVDGCDTRITDLSKGTVPPPMSHAQLKTDYEVNEVTGFGGIWAVLLANRQLQIYKLSDGRKLTLQHTHKLLKKGVYYNLRSNSPSSISVIRSGEQYEVVQLEISEEEIKESYVVSTVPLVWHTFSQSLIVQQIDGECLEVLDGSRKPFFLKRSRGWTNRCVWVEATKSLIQLSSDHELTCNGNLVASNVGSFSIGQDFLLFISLDYQMKAVQLDWLTTLEPNKIANLKDRAVERGAMLVCLDDTRVWMQMPRGNLELIHHRCLLIHKLKKLLDTHDYREATVEMRRQRVDMNLLYDHDPEVFLDNVKTYVDAVDNADLINNFVFSLNGSDCTVVTYSNNYPNRSAVNPMKVKLICQKVRSMVLGIEDAARQRRLFTVALSCFVQESAELTGDALRAIKEASESVPEKEEGLKLREKWLLHMSYMVDAKTLFEHALATYDLEVALLIAETSEWDPKEYLPLLNGFRMHEPVEYMKYHIDVHLNRMQSALRHLALVDNVFDECVAFIKQHNMYQTAIEIYEKRDKRKEIFTLAAEFMFSKSSFKEAALLFSKGEVPEKILECYVMMDNYVKYTKLADKMGIPDSERVPKLLKMAASLEKANSWAEVAEVYEKLGKEKYASRIMECLFNGFKWLKVVEDFRDTHEEAVEAGVVNRANAVLTQINGWGQTLDQHSNRLKLVIANKKNVFEEWLKGERDIDNDAQSEVFSETSSIASKSSRLSRMSTASSRRRKQIDRKKRSLKEGGQYEDCALLSAIKEIYVLIDNQQEEVGELLLALMECGNAALAISLQEQFGALIEKATSLASQVWPTFIFFENLPGPIHEICRCEDGVVRLPSEGFMPQRISIEPELVRPVIRQNVDWKLVIFQKL